VSDRTGSRVGDAFTAALLPTGVGPVFSFPALSFVEESLLNERNTGIGSFDFETSVFQGEYFETGVAGLVCIRVSVVESNEVSSW